MPDSLPMFVIVFFRGCFVMLVGALFVPVVFSFIKYNAARFVSLAFVASVLTFVSINTLTVKPNPYAPQSGWVVSAKDNVKTLHTFFDEQLDFSNTKIAELRHDLDIPVSQSDVDLSNSIKDSADKYLKVKRVNKKELVFSIDNKKISSKNISKNVRKQITKGFDTLATDEINTLTFKVTTNNNKAIVKVLGGKYGI